MDQKYQKAQLEVCEWKEKAYAQVKDMPLDKAIEFLIQQAKPIADDLAKKKEALEKTLTRIQLDILKHLVKAGGTGNVMGFLKYDASDFQKGFDMANDMQNLDYVKLLYSNFNKNLVVVEITLLGRNKSML